MWSSRLFLPLLFILSLLSAQQIGAVHALNHALEQSHQQDQDSPHSTTCEKCATYAQLGSALSVGSYDVALLTIASEALAPYAAIIKTLPALAAVARGPPAFLLPVA